MPDKEPSTLNIGLVGGDAFCEEILNKTTRRFPENNVDAHIVAVADPDHQSPGIRRARKLGLITVKDYHQLYRPEHQIHILVLLTPEQRILEDILETRPPRIRVLAYHVFLLFWKALEAEVGKLLKRNEEIEIILNSIQDHLLVITPNMEIVEVNKAFLHQMGFSREQVIGRKCYEVFGKIHRQCNIGDALCPLNEVIRKQRHVQHVLTRLNQQGESRYIEVTVFPVWANGGRISKFIEISRDITDRKKEEEEITGRLEGMVEERTRQLKETHAKLLHQDKMASLGKLAASVVHEINNPIAGILNLTMLIKRIIEEGAIREGEMNQFGQYLNLMETETRRISRVVSNLLAFSRQSKMDLKSLNLNHLIERILLLNANLLKIHGVQVEKAFDPSLPELVGSEDQLVQVFMNLISNAVEAIEGAEGKHVLTIETRHAIKQEKVFISFKDTGIGIPRENLPKLFEPFFTTKKDGKGVGLGLSVAFGIIQEHGGFIDVQSEVGDGATFTVELPLKQISDAPEHHGALYGRH